MKTILSVLFVSLFAACAGQISASSDDGTQSHLGDIDVNTPSTAPAPNNLESCTLDVQCGSGQVCRPEPGAQYVCEPPGNQGDLCGKSSECVSGLACIGAVRNLVDVLQTPGSCEVAGTTGTVTGTILNVDGTPAANIEYFFMGPASVGGTYTDSNGGFKADLEAGSWELSVNQTALGSDSEAFVSFTITAGATTQLSVQLQAE